MSGFGKKGAEVQEAVFQNDSKTLYRLVNDLTGRHNCQSVPIQDKKWQHPHYNRTAESGVDRAFQRGSKSAKSHYID